MPMSQENRSSAQNGRRRYGTRHLFLVPILMFGFGYLMVPIYDVFCDITGLNGKTGSISVSQAGSPGWFFSMRFSRTWIPNLT